LHRSKKITVTSMALALLMASGVSTAMAARNNDKITICHATGSPTNPYVRINVSENSAKAHGHRQHAGDEFLGEDNANTKQCRTTPPGDDHTDTICHYVEVTDTYDKIRVDSDAPEAHAHDSHIDDVIYRSDDNNSKDCPEGTDEDEGDNCSASSSSGDQTADQRGLVNVGNVDLGLDNLGANALCQSSVLNNVTAAVLGTATGGSTSGSGDEGCTADSTDGDSSATQAGLVNVGNVGNVDVNAANAAANLLCQSEILDNLTVSVLGSSFGGSSFGSGLLGGGLNGLLTGLTADVSVLASVLVLL
jgi:hypothetical protein